MLSNESSKGLSKIDFNECSVQFLLKLDKSLSSSIDEISKARGASIVMRDALSSESLESLRNDVRETCKSRGVDMSIFADMETSRSPSPGRRW